MRESMSKGRWPGVGSTGESWGGSPHGGWADVLEPSQVEGVPILGQLAWWGGEGGITDQAESKAIPMEGRLVLRARNCSGEERRPCWGEWQPGREACYLKGSR